MKTKLFFSLFIYALVAVSCVEHSGVGTYGAIHSGIVWFDQNFNQVNAHGACIVKEGDLYYLFGEYKSDTSNAFIGFGCYSSADLINWRFERVVLPVQKEGLLGPERVGERVKVMKCPATGEFVMYMHTDNMGYRDPHVGYATCETIDGEYQFQGELLHNGTYLHKWDLGTYQDSDGKGYLLTHEGFIYELSEDYKAVERIVVSNVAPGGESPAMFKKDGCYFWLFSNKTSWERNDNYYLTSTSLEGPWERKGNFAPMGTLTWNSQCSFVFPVTNGADTLFLYMGDRWSFPKQGSAATHVWLPVTVDKEGMSIPEFYESWYLDLSDCTWQFVALGMQFAKESTALRKGDWYKAGSTFRSRDKEAMLTYSFRGKQVGIRGISNATSGYAYVTLKDSKNRKVLGTVVDFYSLYEYSSLKFLSPILDADDYTLTIEVMGEHPAWSDKRRSDFGSTDNYVIVEEVLYY